MSKPSKVEFTCAMREAIRLKELTDDPHCVGKTLLNLQYRIKFLEDIKRQAKLYLHSGESAKCHTDLVHAIERSDAAEMDREDDDQDEKHPW